MPKLYKLLLLIVTAFGPYIINAQTNPAPQSLPYSQNFGGLASNSTVYPNGWQGWVVSANAVLTDFRTAAPTGDRALVASTASNNAGNVYNYNGKIGFLTTGTLDAAVALAINTTGRTNISMSFDAMSIRVPSDGSNTRINEMILQYRVGTLGTFTNVPGTEYRNTLNANVTSGTDPIDPKTITFTLPAACENQPVVQLRWISRSISGGGGRPSFAVDNIIIGSGVVDNTPPSITSLTPANSASGITPANSLTATFSEPIIANGGTLVLKNLTNNTTETFNITAANIQGSTITVNAALKANKTYSVSIAAGAVKDAAGNLFAGLNEGAWTFSVAAQSTNINFNTCNTNNISGFTQYSRSGAQTWACSTFGEEGNGVQINGFSGTAQLNEDWLISPAFDLSAFNYPLLRFSSRTRFNGPSLKLMVSTNYDGAGDPANFTWTELNGRFAAEDSDVWTASENIDLSAFKAADVYVAFVYTSSPASNAARWTIDNFNIANSSTPAPPTFALRGNTSIDFDYVAFGSSSVNRSFQLSAFNLSDDVIITAPAGFVISKNGTDFSSSITLTPAEAEAFNTIYVRFVPTAASQNYAGVLNISTGTTINTTVGLAGTSLRTLKVVNWNLEWFGSPNSGQGPTNDDQQQQNVATIMNNLKADIYAIAEIVDTLRFKNLAASLNGNYGYVVGTFGSYADDVNDPDYAGAQKLGFIYNKDVVKNLGTSIVLKNGSAAASYHWSSGRFPYQMKAEVALNGITDTLDIFLIHAKANTGSAAEKREAYERRVNAANELKDSLDAHYPNSKFLIVGDFNDDFDKTITTEMSPVTASSYSQFLADNANYKPLTLPLSLAGLRSTVSNDNVIDHVIASNEMAISYVANSAQVLTSVANMVTSYGSSTSDHYPIVTKYDWRYYTRPTIAVADTTALTETGVCSATFTLGTPSAVGFNAIASITSNAPATYNVGVTNITWTAIDIYGNKGVAVQKVTVKDAQAPAVTAPANVAFCYTAGGNYVISPSTASDNCGIASVVYHITGATTRNGNGYDASGTFAPGVSTITWTVTDIHDNVSTASTTVTVNAPLNASISITPVFTVNPGGQAYTIYLGYGAQSVTLNANVVGGTPTYSYAWTGAALSTTTGNAVAVSPTTTTNYLLTITDAAGCTASATTTVNVVDVRGGNKNDKVVICQVPKGNPGNAKTITVAPEAVATHLANGSYLGACRLSNARGYEPVTANVKAEQRIRNTDVSVIVSPVPAKNNFTVVLSNYKKGAVQVMIYTNDQRLVATKRLNVVNSVETLQFDLSAQSAGTYHIVVVNAEGKRAIRQIIQR